MSFLEFQASRTGTMIAPILADHITVRRMEDLSRRGVPAVAAVDELIGGRIDLDNTQRQYVGRWVREVMARRGWTTLAQKRLSGGKVFTSGMVYKLPAKDTNAVRDLLPFAERLERARAIIRAGSKNDYGVDDFIADKRAEVAREEAKW